MSECLRCKKIYERPPLMRVDKKKMLMFCPLCNYQIRIAVAELKEEEEKCQK